MSFLVDFDCLQTIALGELGSEVAVALADLFAQSAQQDFGVWDAISSKLRMSGEYGTDGVPVMPLDEARQSRLQATDVSGLRQCGNGLLFGEVAALHQMTLER